MSEPVRLTTAEAVALSRLSRATFFRRLAQGRLPRPVDRGRQSLFDREALLRALARGPDDGLLPDGLTPAAEALARRRLELARRKKKSTAS